MQLHNDCWFCVPAPAANPDVFPLSSCVQSYHVVGVLIRGYFPVGPLSVTCNDNGNITKFPPFLTQPDPEFTQFTSIRLLIPANGCPEESSVSCTVKYNDDYNENVKVPCQGQRQLGVGGAH